MNYLAEKYPNFHRLNLSDCLAGVHLPKIDRHRDHIFIMLHFPVIASRDIGESSDGKGDLYEIGQLSVFLDRNTKYIVTIHQNNLEPLAKMFKRYNDGTLDNEEDDADNFVISNNNDSAFTASSIESNKAKYDTGRQKNIKSNDTIIENSTPFLFYKLIDGLLKDVYLLISGGILIIFFLFLL
jgi:hypothetical protein